MDWMRLLFASFFSFLISILTFIYPNEATTLLFITILCIIFLRIVSNMCFWFNVRNSKKFFSNLFLGIFIILISYFVYKMKSSFVLFFQISFIFFFSLDSINRFICFILVRKDSILKGIYYIVSSLISLLICIFIFTKNTFASYLLGLYILEFGVSYFSDFITRVSSYKVKGIKPSIPVLFALFIPYVAYKRVKILKDMGKDIGGTFEDKKADIYISIHVGPKIYSRPGHIDVCFEDEVLAFGQYDKDSLSFFKIFGDGVMYSLNDRLKYYDFVIGVDKKIVFEYGFSLSDKEKDIIRDRIKKIKKNTIPWSSPYDYTYAHKLEDKMGARLYKFSRGNLKKYYSTRNNCVFLVDSLIKDILIDRIDSGSFIIPGNYMYYFNLGIKQRNNRIVSFKIFR